MLVAKGWKRKEINGKNKLRELLDAGKPTIGTHMIITSPQIVEVIGHSSVFDYVELWGENILLGRGIHERFIIGATKAFPRYKLDDLFYVSED